MLVCKIHREPAILFHRHPWVIGIEFGYALYSFCSAIHALLMFVHSHAHHYMVEQWQSTAQYVVMSYGIGVKTTHKNACLHICKSPAFGKVPLYSGGATDIPKRAGQ